MSNRLTLPLYASKPQRKVPGTDVIAVTLYAASDRSYREYALFTREGERLGDVTSHQRRLGLSAGYHEGRGSYDHRKRTWSNLTEAALALIAEKEA